MMNNKILFLLVLISLIFMACRDENLDSKKHFFQCEMDGQEFERSGVLAYAVATLIDEDYTVYGASDSVGEDLELTTIYINFPRSIEEGTHDFEDDVIYAYVIDYEGSTFSTERGTGDGSIKITKITDTEIEGEFSFTAYDFDDDEHGVDVIDGEFEVDIRL